MIEYQHYGFDNSCRRRNEENDGTGIVIIEVASTKFEF